MVVGRRSASAVITLRRRSRLALLGLGAPRRVGPQWQAPKSGARSGPVHAVKQSAIINIQDKQAGGREHAEQETGKRS